MTHTNTTPVENLTEGDLIDFEPLLIQWGTRDETYEADLIAAEFEMGLVEVVVPNADGSVTIYSDLMNLAVPAGTPVSAIRANA